MNNNTIEILRNHKSIRKFNEKKISNEDFETILLSGQAAPSSSNGQSYSIISVTDFNMRERIADLVGGQQHVNDCSHFLVFCADLNRLEQITGKANENISEVLDSTEMHLIATIDATLVAQNIAVAAESMGLGTVYIGGIRNNPLQISELLELPFRVYPVFGMCLGCPEQNDIPGIKPRLPLKAVYHENTYDSFDVKEEHINQYDEIMSDYYSTRTDGKRTDTWSDTITDKRKVPRRMHMKCFLNERGFLLD